MSWKSIAIFAAAFALIAASWFARRPASVMPATDTVTVVAQATTPTSVVASAPAPAATPTSVAVNTAIPDDPAVAATLLAEDQTPATYYRRLRAERRDPAWASRAESGIGAALAAIPNLDGTGSPPRVTCAATLCEVHGALRRGLPMEEADGTMQALQGEALRRRLGTEDMEVPAASFGGKADMTEFTLYVARTRRR